MLIAILVCSVIMNMFFGLLCFSSIIYGGMNYLNYGIIPSTNATLNNMGWNTADFYSSKYIGYNEIINWFLNTNCINGSFDLLCLSFILSWIISGAVDIWD